LGASRGLAGLQHAAFAARTLGREADAERFCGFAGRYWKAIEKSLERSEKQAGFHFFPATPYRRIDSGAIGSLCAVYPLRLLRPNDPRVLNTIRLLEDRFLIGEGFFQDHFHSGVNCYLSAHLAQCYLANGNARAWKIVRYLLKRASSTYTWPEAFHPITKGGCMGEGHHGWATADWTLLHRKYVRNHMGQMC
jgi:GH15 family glucan-1,4-alpha-glucosidase